MPWEIREEIINEHLQYLACEIGADNSECAVCPTLDDARAIVDARNYAEKKLDPDGLLGLFLRRRSIRQFTPEPVTGEMERKILQAGLLAPSSMGKRNVEFIVVRDINKIRAMAEYKKHGAGFFGTATLAIGVIANSNESDVWIANASLAAYAMQLEAEALGLGSCWAQLLFRTGARGPADDAFKKDFGVPAGWGALCVIAIGHKAGDLPPHALDKLDWSRVKPGNFQA